MIPRIVPRIGFLAAVLAIATFAPTAATADPAFFTGVGTLGEETDYSSANAISADGTTVVGTSVSRTYGKEEPFIWTLADGINGLGYMDGTGGLPDTSNVPGWAADVSADGKYVVGYYVPNNYNRNGFRWSAAGGFESIAPSANSIPYSISADGSHFAGFTSGTQNTDAVWSSLTSWTSLGFSSYCHDIAADDTVAVGVNLNTKTAFYRSSSSPSDIHYLPDPTSYEYASAAYGITPDKSVIVGYANDNSTGNNEGVRWVWDDEDAVYKAFPLGDLAGGAHYSFAEAVSDDGSVIVGNSSADAGYRATIWTPDAQMRDLNAVLVDDYGLDLTGWTLTGAYDVSADGTTIVGYGTNPDGVTEGWVAHLGDTGVVPEPISMAFMGSAFLGVVAVRRRRRRRRDA